MGLPEIPKPKDEVPVAPSDDEPLLTIDTDNKEITMSRQDTMKMRKMNAEISGRNELKAKQRLLYAKELKKFANLEVERKECRSNLLEALDYENLIDLDEAMKEAAALGLEGKNRDKTGAWRCRELKEAYRLRPGIEQRQKNAARLRTIRTKKAKDASEERAIRHEEYLMKEEKTRKYRVGADLVGKDRFHNRYWMFSWNPEVLYVEYVSSSGANGTCTGTASSGRYVLYMLVVLVVSLPGQHYEHTCSDHFGG